MDWVPVNVDSPAGEGVGAGRNSKVSEPNLF